jgi:hypothetical protein
MQSCSLTPADILKRFGSSSNDQYMACQRRAPRQAGLLLAILRLSIPVLAFFQGRLVGAQEKEMEMGGKEKEKEGERKRRQEYKS